MSLEESRTRIDEIDAKIVKLIAVQDSNLRPTD